MDNRIYGMTKGQPSPTTEADWDSDAAPGGTGVKPFSPLAIALAAGANFVARGFALDVKPLATDLLSAGIDLKEKALSAVESAKEDIADAVAEAQVKSQEKKARAEEAEAAKVEDKTAEAA